MQKNDLGGVFKRYLDNQFTEEEFKIIQDHFQNEGDREKLISWIKRELENEYFSSESIQKTQRVLRQVDQDLFNRIHEFQGTTNASAGIVDLSRKRSLPKRLIKVAVAASIILVGAAALYFASSDITKASKQTEYIAVNDLNPGGNRATLRLSDGSAIELSDSKEGIVIGEGAITYSDGSEIILPQKEKEIGGHAPQKMGASLDEEVMLTLSTPNGGKYDLTLSDGTKVTLNAASSITYPSRFRKGDRKVEVTGEVYFDVAKMTNTPFIVESVGQEIVVLGTQFNVNAYNDDGETRTTLVEGSVQIKTTSLPSRTVQLNPGQQSAVSGADIQVKRVNTNDYTAWKENLLVFEGKSLKSILQTLGRWYDFQVDVSQIPDVTLSGAIPTTVKFSEVITLLEETSKVKLKVEQVAHTGERRVTIN